MKKITTLPNDKFTKLKKLKGIQMVGFDKNHNRYIRNQDTGIWKRAEYNKQKKKWECGKIGKPSRIKLVKKGAQLPEKSFHAFDVETKDGLKGKELFCWSMSIKGAAGKMTTLNGGETLDKFFDYFQEKMKEKKSRAHQHNQKQITVIFVHNLSFDIRFIVDYCVKKDIEFKPIISGSNFIACALDTLGIKFIDTVQFLKTSQEKAELEWGIETGIKKEETSDLMKELFVNNKHKDGLKPFKKWTKLEKETLKYHCENDVKALHKIMEKFRQTMADISGVDALGVISLASLSMKALRGTLGKTEILNPFLIYSKTKKGKIMYKIDRLKEDFVRKSYYGGRNELFDLNRYLMMVYCDRVSMYPAEMKNQLYPSGIPYWLGQYKEEIPKLMDIITGKDKKLGFIECLVKRGKATTNYPVLPKRIDGRIMFTDCTIRGIWTSIELVYAYKMGYEITPIKGLVYPMKEDYFSKFVDKFYPIKTNNKGGKKKAAKIILNSSYGKFGQSFERKTLDIKYFNDKEKMKEYLMEAEEPENLVIRYSEEYRLFLVMNPRMSMSKKRFMNVAIASFITAYSRLSLVKMFHLCEKWKIDVKYADTDSFTVDEKEFIRLTKMKSNAKIFTTKLGGWDIEKTFEEVEFVAPKCYISIEEGKTTLKMKGINKRKVDEICESVDNAWIKNPKMNRLDMAKKLIAEPIEEAERFMTFKESLRAGMVLSTKKLTKHYTLENFKRNFNPYTGKSKAWNDETILPRFMDDLIEKWDEKEVIKRNREVEQSDMEEI